ncbi:MAG TPA: response regulator [Candidatus Angelobacter sp.]|nr:response regulator [Candidatus Angelobacter sp.]
MTKVAIVEDNPMLRQYLAELISATADYDCVGTCGSAEEAMVKIPKYKPAVVLMDIHLPGESGIPARRIFAKRCRVCR